MWTVPICETYSTQVATNMAHMHAHMYCACRLPECTSMQKVLGEIVTLFPPYRPLGCTMHSHVHAASWYVCPSHEHNIANLSWGGGGGELGRRYSVQISIQACADDMGRVKSNFGILMGGKSPIFAEFQWKLCSVYCIHVCMWCPYLNANMCIYSLCTYKCTSKFQQCSYWSTNCMYVNAVQRMYFLIFLAYSHVWDHVKFANV